jgi:uncharacterized protein YgbK (DUF1537 family)
VHAHSILFGAVADDLTGGVDLASEMVSNGVSVDFRVGPPDGEIDADAVASIVALKSRVAPPSIAVEQTIHATRWLMTGAPRQMFFKYSGSFDSTNTGNIGCCVDEMRDLAQADRVIFCPTHPLNERTVYNGYLFFGHLLVSDSSKRHDPLTPMMEPDLTRVLAAQTKSGVGLLPWRVISRGMDAMRKHVEDLVASGKPYVIADAISDEDLDRLAELTADWRLVTGNAKIGAHLAKLWNKRGQLDGAARPKPLGQSRGPGAILAGSCADQTLAQLKVLENQGGQVLYLDLIQAASSPEAIADQALVWARERMGEKPVAIATSAAPQEVSEIQAKFGREGVAEVAERSLAYVARGLIQAGVGRLVVAGGETSGAVINALNIKRLAVGPQMPGSIPLAEADVGRPLGLCLKSGKLGPDDIFMERLDAMEAGLP